MAATATTENRVDVCELVRNNTLRMNLCAVVMLWSSQSFSYYLVGFYTKYFEGNFFVNYAMLGIADAIAFGYVKVLSTRFSTPSLIRILLLGVLFGCFLFLYVSEPYPSLIPFLIIIIRMHVSAVLNYGYYINSFLFPVLLRGNVYAITNVICRPFSALATLVVEYTR